MKEGDMSDRAIIITILVCIFLWLVGYGRMRKRAA